MELTGAYSGTVTFGGPTGTLKIDNSASVTVTIGDPLAIGDKIDLPDITAGAGALLGYSGNNSPGMLTVGDGTRTAHINLLGNHVLADFIASSDGHNGTFVVDPPIASVTPAPRTTILPVASFHPSATTLAGAQADNVTVDVPVAADIPAAGATVSGLVPAAPVAVPVMVLNAENAAYAGSSFSSAGAPRVQPFDGSQSQIGEKRDDAVLPSTESRRTT
jgi:hypothetical protein